MGDTVDFIVLVVCLGLSFFMIFGLFCGLIKIGRRKRGGGGGDYDEVDGEEGDEEEAMMEAGEKTAAGGAAAAGGILGDLGLSQPFGFDAEFEEWYHGAFHNDNKAKR